MGKFVYKNQDSLNKMHAFYDKTLAALGVPYTEEVCKRAREFLLWN
jgi:hypothetical protein